MMLERSSYFRLKFCPHSRSVGYKTEFAFDHLPDVGTVALMVEQCAAQFLMSWAQVPF